MKRCIVSLANDRGNYHKCLDRLEESIKKHNPEIDFFGYRSEAEVGAPEHLVNPYAFKLFAVQKAFRDGYTQILWLDSSCYAVGDITPLFNLIERDGYAMQEAGFHVGDWCNDETLDYFEITREEASKMLMYGNAGLLGLNTENITAMAFLFEWAKSMMNGCFIGDWSNHRHDMSCGSIIANKLGMTYNIKGGEILEYAAPEMPNKNETIILKAQGL